MPNKADHATELKGLEPARQKGTIQSVDRAARILRALASGPRRLGVSELAERLGHHAPDGPWAAPDASGARLRRAGSGVREVPARSRAAPSRQLLPRPERAARPLDRPRGAPGRAHVGLGARRGHARTDAWSSSTTSSARTPPFRSSRSVRSCPCTRARSARRSSPTPRGSSSTISVAEGLPKLTGRTLTASALREELKAVCETGIARERDEAVLGESSLAGTIFDRIGAAVGRDRGRRRDRDHHAARAVEGTARGGQRRCTRHLARARRAPLAGRGNALEAARVILVIPECCWGVGKFRSKEPR